MENRIAYFYVSFFRLGNANIGLGGGLLGVKSVDTLCVHLQDLLNGLDLIKRLLVGRVRVRMGYETLEEAHNICLCLSMRMETKTNLHRT